MYLPNSPAFRYENNILTPTADPNASGGYSSNVLQQPYALNYRVAFTCNCSQFEAVIQVRQSPYRLWVNGAYVRPIPQILQVPLSPSTGNNYLYLNGHPTPLGHDYPGEKIAFDLLVRFPWLLPQLHSLSHPVPVAGQFSYSVPFGTLLSAGADTVSASFTPANTASFTPASRVTSVTVTKASTGITITFSQTSGGTTIRAIVSPQIAGIPTGQLTFTDGGVPVSTVVLTNGIVSLTLSPGTHKIGASYTSDSNFLPSAGSIAISASVVPSR